MEIVVSVTYAPPGDPGQVPKPSGKGYTFRFDKDEVLVGRDEAVDVRLPHPAVSLVHLRLVRRKGQVHVVDTGSTNGTWVDGQTLTLQAACPLQPGALVSLGPFALQLGKPSDAGSGAARDTASFARSLALDVMAAQAELTTEPYLELCNGPQRGSRMPLPDGGEPQLVGRARETDFPLDDADVSRHHMEVRRRGDLVQVRDLGSKNGLLVGEVNAGPDAWLTVRHGQEVTVGCTRLLLVDPAVAFLSELRLAPDDMSPALKKMNKTNNLRRSSPDEIRHGPSAVKVDLCGGERGDRLLAWLVGVLLAGAALAALAVLYLG